MSVPSVEESEELLLSCRYGDLEDIQAFISKYGQGSLNEIRDDSGNTILHMVSANGHVDVLEYLLPIVSPSLLSIQNDAKSTALHWAALNQHLAVAQKLVQFAPGPGIDLIDIKNAAGRSPLGEAENIGWDEGAQWFVKVMNLDETSKGEEELVPTEDPSNIQVEIQDAEGQVAKMTIEKGGSSQIVSTPEPPHSRWYASHIQPKADHN